MDSHSAHEPFSRRVVGRLLQKPFVIRTLRRVGCDAARANYESPIPRPDELPPSTWDQPSQMSGIDMDLASQRAFLEATLAPYLTEFRNGLTPFPAGRRFEMENLWYGPLDAEVLYAMVRHFKPQRILELGSGWSTVLIGHALTKNADEAGRSRHEVFDPYRVRDCGTSFKSLQMSPSCPPRRSLWKPSTPSIRVTSCSSIPPTQLRQGAT